MAQVPAISIPKVSPNGRDIAFAVGILTILSILFLPIPVFMIDMGLALLTTERKALATSGDVFNRAHTLLSTMKRPDSERGFSSRVDVRDWPPGATAREANFLPAIIDLEGIQIQLQT